jgi:hypothetical protein
MSIFKKNKEKKTKAQTEAEEKRTKEVERKRLKAKNDFYPLLERSSANIANAKTFCDVLSVAIRQAFQNKTRSTKVVDLELVGMLNDDDPRNKEFKEALMMFADENMNDALEIIEGMSQAIDGFIREEMQKRTLKTLKTDFL